MIKLNMKNETEASNVWRALQDWFANYGEPGDRPKWSGATEIHIECQEPAELLEGLLEDEVFDPTEVEYELGGC